MSDDRPGIPLDGRWRPERAPYICGKWMLVKYEPVGVNGACRIVRHERGGRPVLLPTEQEAQTRADVLNHGKKGKASA